MSLVTCRKFVFEFKILHETCKISNSKGVYEKKIQLVSVLLIKKSGNSCFIWISVSFSYQKYTNEYSRIQKLARFLQDFESGLIFFIEFDFEICLINENLLQRCFQKHLYPDLSFALIDIF